MEKTGYNKKMVKKSSLFLFVILFNLFFIGCVSATDGTGGTITHDGLYTVHTFLSNGTFVPPSSGTNVTVLVVAGGGGGASRYGGGGGAGGLIYNNSYNASGSITVGIGTGGAGNTNGGSLGDGTNGGNSIFGTLTAIGGGGGGGSGSGHSGGSGGGNQNSGTAGGAGTAGQGNNGGFGNASYVYLGSGGGGAGGVGEHQQPYIDGHEAGNGGAGLNYSINGTAVNYSCGGGGGAYQASGDAGQGGSGGCGGSKGAGSTAGSVGVANTGSGGGGGSGTQGGYNGGSGIVIVRYLTPFGVSFSTNTPASGNFLGNSIFVNFTIDNGAAISSSIIRLYNSSSALINSSTTRGINFTNLNFGVYYINVTATNSSGTNASTETRTIFLGNSMLSGTLLNPANATLVNNSNAQNFTANFSTNFGIANATFNLYGTVNTLDEGLLAYYRLDDTDGTTIVDSSGNGHNGVGTYTPYASGVTGRAVSFDGSTNSISAEGIDIRDKSYTINVWAHVADNNINRFICSQGTWTGSSGELHIGFQQGGGEMSWNYWFGSVISLYPPDDTTNWHMWTFDYDMNANTRTVYEDGSPIGGDSPSTPYTDTASTFYIGSLDGNSAAEGFYGQMDDFRIYGRALTQSEINALYSLNPSYESSLINQTTTNFSANTLNAQVENYFNLSEGNFIWKYNYCDWVGDCNSTENRTFSVDLYAPTLTSSSPVNGTIVQNTTTISANITDAVSGIKNATLNVYNSTGLYFNQSAGYHPGKALSFDGTGYVDTGLGSYFNSGISDVSVSAWIKFTTGGVSNWFFDKTSSDINYPIEIKVNPDNKLEWTTGRVDENFDALIGTTVLSPDTWYHVAFVGTPISKIIYLNGQIEISNSAYGSVMADSSEPLWIGGRSDGSGGFYGKIDNVEVFNRNLNLTDVSLLYNSGRGLAANISVTPFNSGLVAGYNFDDSNPTIVTDITGNYNGTLNGGVTYVAGIVQASSASGFDANILTATVGVTVTLVQGVYTWFWSLFDWAGNQANTENQTLISDTTPPQINLTTPNQYATNILSGDFAATASDNYGLNNATIHIFNQSNNQEVLFNLHSTTIGDVSGGLGVEEYNQGPGFGAYCYSYQFNVYAYTTSSNGTIVYSANPDVINFQDQCNWNYYSGIQLTWNPVDGAEGYKVVVVDDNYGGFFSYSTNCGWVCGNGVDGFSESTSATSIDYGGYGDMYGWYGNTMTYDNPEVTTPASPYLIDDGTNIHYFSGALSSVFDTSVSLGEGTYNWFYNLCDLAGNCVSSDNRTFIVDQTPPVAKIISYTPNSTDAVDPLVNITVNALVTDDRSGVATATLQYYNGSVWNTLLMNLTSGDMMDGNYSATFETQAAETNYTFNVLAQDFAGNTNVSANTIFASYYDCTWNMSKASGSSLGQFFGWEQKVNFVNFTIYNTGDANFSNSCPLNFIVYQNLLNSGEGSLRIDDHFGPSQAYENITAGQSVNVQLYFNYRSQIYSDALNATVDEDSGNANPQHTDYLGGTLISTSGPYLYQVQLSPVSNMSSDFIIQKNSTYYEVYLTNQTLIFNNSLRNGVGDGTTNKTAYNVTSSVLFDPLFNLTSQGDADSVTNTFNTINVTDNITNITTEENIGQAMNFFYNNISDGSNGETHSNSLIMNLTDYVNSVDTSKDYLFQLNSYGYNSSGSQIVHANNTIVLNDSLNIKFLCNPTPDGFCVDQCNKNLLGVNATNFDPDCAYCGDGKVEAGEDCSTCPIDVIAASNNPAACAPASVGSSNSAGGGGGSGSGGSGGFAQSSATYELVRGQQNDFTFDLQNSLDSPKKNINVTVTGDNSKYVNVDPSMIGYLAPLSNATLKVHINAPSYFAAGKNLLTFTFTGTIAGNITTPFTEVKYVTLIILELPRATVDGYMNSSEQIIQEMNSAGLVTTDVSNLYSTMKQEYASLNFNDLANNYKQIQTVYDSANQSKVLFKSLNSSINNAEANGVVVSETKKLMYLAQILYDRGDYVNALAQLKQAELTFALETKGEFNLAYTIKNNPLQSLGILLGAIILTTGSSLLVRIRLLKRKLRILSEEEQLLLQLMKVVQKDCFEEKRMSMEEYGEAMAQYEARLEQVIEERIKTETEVANVMKIKGKRLALKQEEQRLFILVRQTQEDYLNRGKIDTRVYENMLKTYSSRLSKVQEEMVFIEAQEELSRSSGSWISRLFRGTK